MVVKSSVVAVGGGLGLLTVGSSLCTSLVVMTDNIGCCGSCKDGSVTEGTMTDGHEEDIAPSSSVFVASRTLSPTGEVNNYNRSIL